MEKSSSGVIDTSSRRFRISAEKTNDAPKRVPERVEEEVWAAGPASALAHFRRLMLAEHGNRARQYFPAPTIVELEVD